jgi:hypothetical protein
MKTPKRRFIGIGILVAAVLAAAAFQVFGHGLIVKTEQHPSTPPELAAKVAGANRRWRLPFRCRGSRRESAVAQLSTLGHIERLCFFTTKLHFIGLGGFVSLPSRSSCLAILDGWV